MTKIYSRSGKLLFVRRRRYARSLVRSRQAEMRGEDCWMLHPTDVEIAEGNTRAGYHEAVGLHDSRWVRQQPYRSQFRGVQVAQLVMAR